MKISILGNAIFDKEEDKISIPVLLKNPFSHATKIVNYEINWQALMVWREEWGWLNYVFLEDYEDIPNFYIGDEFEYDRASELNHIINYKEPFRIDLVNHCLVCEPNGVERTATGMHFLFQNKVVNVTDSGHLTESEINLEVVNAVLNHGSRYQQIQRQLNALKNTELAEIERRERISDDVRMFVWQRDQGKCVKCGNNERLEFDHIIPVVKGGSNTERNIQLLCERCNREKGARF